MPGIHTQNGVRKWISSPYVAQMAVQERMWVPFCLCGN